MNVKVFSLQSIPNLLTLINMSLGFVAVIMAFNVDLIMFVPYLVMVAAVIDFLDGFLARKLNVVTDFGKQLDSFADLISFGVVPGILLYQLQRMAVIVKFESTDPSVVSNLYLAFLFSGALIPVFSAIRLARFNLDTEGSTFFKGLPTPASGLLISFITLIFFTTEISVYRELIIHPVFLTVLAVGLPILMVCNLKLFSLKFKSFSYKENKLRYIFLMGVILLVVFTNYIGLALSIIWYIVLSVIEGIIKK